MVRCVVPYRVDLDAADADVVDRLIDLGAIDVEAAGAGVAALLPDAVDVARVKAALGRDDIRTSPARGRDGDSVWVLRARPVQVGRLQLLPEDAPAASDGLRLVDDAAFGTGLHPTTALCLDALDAEIAALKPARVLDIGTGSGVLALAALRAGVGHVTAVDIDAHALRVAARNAELNALASRIELLRGGPEVVTGAWPLVVANILAAPLIEMAPELARHVAHRGLVILSGIRLSLGPEVEQAYRRSGMWPIGSRTRDGWTAMTFQASW
jgi:ribosomal protein L11 methyltransferase